MEVLFYGSQRTITRVKLFLSKDMENRTKFTENINTSLTFSGWDFFTGDDPTRWVSILFSVLAALIFVLSRRGNVKSVERHLSAYVSLVDGCALRSSYVNQSTAMENGYIFVQDNGTVIMKVDDTTTLPMGTNRPRSVSYGHSICCDLPKQSFHKSVRITSKKQYTTGLFISDINRAPWGCGKLDIVAQLSASCPDIIEAIWPAFWTVGGNWPYVGKFSFPDLHLILKSLYRTGKSMS